MNKAIIGVIAISVIVGIILISTTQMSEPTQTNTQNTCDTSYPNVCIAPSPPNLNCNEIEHSNFKVVGDDPHGFDDDHDGIGCETTSKNQLAQPTSSDISMNSSQDCSGTAGCIIGTVTKIIDGDTIHVDDQSARFSLATAPNLEGYGGTDSRDFIQTICPIGSDVLVDEDDGHVLGSYGRVVGMVSCNGVILNEELLDAGLGFLEVRFCDSSEFANEPWAQKHGCADLES